MFGLEKKEKNFDRFRFDLEVEISEDPEKAKEIISRADQQTEKIKKTLKSAPSREELDNLGILLHAYEAVKRVTTKVEKNEATK